MADTMELTEQSTTEEVKEYAAQVVEEIKAEREPKPDAQIVSETADLEKKPVAEKKSSDEKKAAKAAKAEAAKAAKAEKVVPAKAEKAGEESWLDDDLKAEVSAYGLEESDLADFASREELERALRLFDKNALDAGRKALAAEAEGKESAEPATRNEKGQFLPKKETPAVEPKTDGRYEIKLDKAVYDEEIVGEFTAMRDHYEAREQAMESRFKALESRLLEVDAKAEEQHFDSLVDSLDHADLFGTTGKETPEQFKRREDLHVQAKALQNGLAQLGRPTELNESLVSRVARMVFAEDFTRKEIKNRTRKISKQANGRQGGGATRPQDPREDPRDKYDRMYKELESAS